MSNPKTSKPDSSAMKSQALAAFDKLYWLRIGLAALGGVSAEVVASGDWTIGLTIGIAIYLASYYLALYTWYRGMSREVKGKVYTTGVGSFVLVFLFTWMTLFTLRVAGYSV